MHEGPVGKWCECWIAVAATCICCRLAAHVISRCPRHGGRYALLAGVAELVDALDLGSSDESCGGSSPSARTTSRSPCARIVAIRRGCVAEVADRDHILLGPVLGRCPMAELLISCRHCVTSVNPSPLGRRRLVIIRKSRQPGRGIRQEFHRVLETTETAGASHDGMRHFKFNASGPCRTS